MKFIKFKLFSICALALLVASCGGHKVTSSIGGTVSGPGLSATNPLVLQDNGTDNLNVTGNTFTFATQLEAGSVYDVTILTLPAGQTCFVENGIGVVRTSIGNVNSIAIVCNETISAANDITGQVTGLNSGNSVTLLNNGTDSVKVVQNGAFAFATPLAINAPYSVVVQNNPTNQTCTLGNASGIITSNGMVPTQITTKTNGVTSTVPNSTGIVANIIVSCQ